MVLKVPLFINYKERIFALFVLILIFFINIFFEYNQYKRVFKDRFFETKATVLNQYKKDNHFVLKLKSEDGFTFYTSSKESLKDLRFRDVEVLLIKTKYFPTFLEYLKGFYVVSYIKGILPKTLKYKIYQFLSNQHKSSISKELYTALFLASSISKELREKLSFYSLSHLVAISGFHLGLISTFLYFLIFFLLKPIYQRFFPYKNLAIDSMIIISLVGFLYLLFLGDVPSLIRAYVMMVFGFFLIYRHIDILSFETLFWSVLLILALFVKLIFSIGFWLSVAGVFYIYLFLHYFKDLKKWQIFLFLNIWIYMAMVPIVHFFFYNFSYIQLFSPIISITFIIFYPFSFISHLFGYGDILDDILIKFFSLEFEKNYFETSIYFFIFYIALSILSIYKKWVFYAFIFISAIFFIYNIANLQSI